MAKQGGDGGSGSGWRTFASVLTAIAALAGGYAAVRGSWEATEYVEYLKASKRETYAAGPQWKTSREWRGDWKQKSFDDRDWSAVVTPAPDRQTLSTADAAYTTMWSPGGAQRGTSYFRRIISMPDRDRIERVTILSAADDDHRIYLNGTAVTSDVDHAAGPVVFTDVTPFVETGDNVFAIVAVNDSGGCWIAVNIQVQRK